MRVLMFHVDTFRSTITEKGRTRSFETYENRTTEVFEALLVLMTVEKSDETDTEAVAARATAEIANIARQVGATRIVLHPFAHLFTDLARPDIAIDTIKEVETSLIAQAFETTHTPFGWFHTLEIKAKGHPLSRIARIV